MPAPTRPVKTDRDKLECRSSRYVTLGGKRIHYCVEGRGPALLLLHGVMGSLHSWQGWVDQLSPYYRIVRLDLPGFGNSGHLASDDYSPEHALELIDQLCAHLHLEQLSIAGNSLGGFFAWYYAANRPERVEKLILLDPLGYPQKLPPLISLMSLPLLGGLAGYLSPDTLLERVLRMRNPAAMVQVSRQLRSFDGELARHIPRVRCATLLMWGQEDRWVPVELLDAWRRDLPSAQVKVYPGIGHVPMEEIPELTALDAHAFLSGGVHTNWDDEAPRDSAIPFVFARPA
jgi:pimeloyl-ACP methyl ester carboxylesterase